MSAVATAAVRVLLPRYEVALSTTPSAPVAGNPITLNAAVTLIDGAPAPTSYEWDCTGDGVLDGTTAVNSFAGCSFPSAGTALVAVAVSNPAAGLTKSATLVVTVAPPPVPVITISPAVPQRRFRRRVPHQPPWAACSSALAGSPRSTGIGATASPHTMTTTNVGMHNYPGALTFEVIAIVTVSGNPSTGTGHGTVKP